jgi:hypothetical protein
MLWGEKSGIILISYRRDCIDDEARAVFSRRQPRKHFGAQLDIRMYSFVYESRAQRAKRPGEVSLCAWRSALCVFLINRQPLLFH